MGKRLQQFKQRIVKQFHSDDALDPKKSTVHVFMPSYPGPKIHTVQSVLDMVTSFPAFRKDCQAMFSLATGGYMHVLRNDAVIRMMKDKRSIGVLMIDHDAVFPTFSAYEKDGVFYPGFNALDRLLSLNKPIIGGLFTTRLMPVQLMCGGFAPSGGLTFLDDEEKGHPLNAEPFTVDWIGAHLLYVSREAVEIIADHVGSYEKIFDCSSILLENGPRVAELHEAMAAFKSGTMDDQSFKLRLENIVDRSGFYQEDVSFCRRARAAGLEIWVDPKFEIHHIGDYQYGRLDWIAQKMHREEQQSGSGAPVAWAGDVPKLRAVR